VYKTEPYIRFARGTRSLDRSPKYNLPEKGRLYLGVTIGIVINEIKRNGIV